MGAKQPSLSVWSESDHLRRALVQPPGPGMGRVNPSEIHWHGFTDVIDIPAARFEHDILVDVLVRLGVEVHRLDRMLYEMLEHIDQRERQEFLKHVLDLNPRCPPTVRERLHQMGAARLTMHLLHGITADGSLQEAVDGVRFHIKPLSNIAFLQDTAVVVGERMVAGFMASGLRAGEELLIEELVLRHPSFGSWGEGVFWVPPSEREARGEQNRSEAATTLEVRWAQLIASQGAEQLNWTVENLLLFAEDLNLRTGPPLSVEGGDLLMLSGQNRRCLMVGVGRRTSPDMVDLLADRMIGREDGGVDCVLAVVLPEREDVRTLDTLLAAPHPEHVIAYNPVLCAPGMESARYYTMMRSGRRVRATAQRSLQEALEVALGDDAPQVHSLPGDGVSVDDQVASEHAQWSGALNLLTVAPGIVIVFERADALLGLLSDELDYSIVDHRTLVAGASFSGPTAITIPGGELSRAGGGPRSLVLPLVRELQP